MSDTQVSPRLRMILHSLATRVPQIVLCRAEDVFPALHTSTMLPVPEDAEIMSRQQIGHLTAPGIVEVKSEYDTVFLPQDAEPEIVHISSEDDISNVEKSSGEDNEVFPEQNNVTEHRSECNYLCEVCKMVLSSQKSLLVHKCLHSRQRCNSHDVCQKVVKKRNYLQVRKIVHRGESCYSCDVGGKSFVQLCHLRGHVQIHSGKSLFSCNVCNKSFTEHRNYKRHWQTIHCGERPFLCHVCNKSYTSLSNLMRHKLIHSGKRSFVCCVCEKSFTQLPTLKRHELIHSGDRPYSCDICKKSFTRRYILRVHLKTHKQGASVFT